MPRMTRPEQPKLDLERSAVEIVVQMIGAVAVAASVFTVVYFWSELPGRVPIHFDITGQPDGFGGRIWIVLLPLVSTVLWGGMTLLCSIPHQYNYVWKITPENARRQYRLARVLLSAMGSGAAVLLSFLTLEICRIATGRSGMLGSLWSVSLLGFLLVALVWYFVAAYRAR